MSALANQPTNSNFLSPLGFKFAIKKTPLTNYFVQAVSLPSISIGSGEVPNPFIKFRLPGTNLTFGSFSITFKVDEDMKNYMEIYNWLIEMGFPDSFDQYNGSSVSGDGTSIYSDCTLTVLSSAMNPNKEITFIECYPTALSSLTFSSTSTDVTYVEATATFDCRKFEIRQL